VKNHRMLPAHRSTRPNVTDRVAWSVCWSVTVVSPAKTAQPIEMPFGLFAWMDSTNHVL